MKKRSLVITAIFLFSVFGCSSPRVTPISPLEPSSNPATLTNTPEKATKQSKLQITYLNLNHDSDYSEVFARDITCVEEDKLCVGVPMLLFKTLPASSDSQTSPMGIIKGYSWSPNGNQIVLSASKDIFIGDIDTKQWKNITNSPDVDERYPVWSADGKYIYYLSCTQVQKMGYCKLARTSPTEEKESILLGLVDKAISTFAISPDGQTAVFSVAKGFESLYQSNIDGSDFRMITTLETEDTSPSFSPDGKRIVFVRTNAPTLTGSSKLISDVIMRDLESGQEINLTEKFDNEASRPVFSPYGKWIAFHAFDSELNVNVYVVSIDPIVIIQVTQGSLGWMYPTWRLLQGE